MLSKSFGPQSWNVPVIGQGTWNLAESGDAREEAKRALRHGIDLGMVHIDTAEMYGRAEEVIAEAIDGIPREQLFIVSKVLPSHASFDGTLKACETSFRRLGIDYLDCYLLHWRGSLPLQATMEALEQLVSEGKIRSLGVSNFEIDGLKEAQSYLKKERIACNQVLYNLGERGIERRLIPYCQKNEISVVGYTPFGSLPSPTSAAGKALQSLANKQNCTVRQIVLSFLTHEDGVFAIPKASVVSHTEENAKASQVKLDQADLSRINDLFPAPAKDVPLATG